MLSTRQIFSIGQFKLVYFLNALSPNEKKDPIKDNKAARIRARPEIFNFPVDGLSQIVFSYKIMTN